MSAHVIYQMVFFGSLVRAQTTKIRFLAGMSADMRFQVGGNGCSVRAEGTLEFSGGGGDTTIPLMQGETVFLNGVSAHTSTEVIQFQSHLPGILLLLIAPQNIVLKLKSILIHNWAGEIIIK